MGKFIECDSCRAKPGTPVLCAGCIHNRSTISAMVGRMPQRADELLHQLWSKAVGTETYDKKQWRELSLLIEHQVYGGGG